MFLTLCFPIFDGKIIVFVIKMQDFSDFVVSLLCNSSTGSFQTNGFDDVCKGTSCMNPTACNLQVFTFACELVINLISKSSSIIERDWVIMLQIR